MLYISTRKRADISIFRAVVYNYIRENKLRYSDQRERVLKILYSQSYPVSTKFLVQKLNEQSFSAGYATVSRHLKFFKKLDMLIVIKKTEKGFLLKKDINCDEVEIINQDHFSYKRERMLHTQVKKLSND